MLRLFSKTDSGKSHYLLIPQSWAEVTVHQYQRMVAEWDKKDPVKLFSILSGLPYGGISQSSDKNVERTMYETIRFISRDVVLWDQLPVPKAFKMKNGKIVSVPKKIGNLSIGQNIVVRQKMEEKIDLKECISFATAVFLQPLVDESPFDVDRALELEKEILKMPIVYVFPVGFFLLKRLNKRGITFLDALNRTLANLLSRLGLKKSAITISLKSTDSTDSAT